MKTLSKKIHMVGGFDSIDENALLFLDHNGEDCREIDLTYLCIVCEREFDIFVTIEVWDELD